MWLCVRFSWPESMFRQASDRQREKLLLCALENRRHARWHGSFVFLVRGLCKKFSTAIARVVVVDQRCSRRTSQPAFLTQADRFSEAAKTMRGQIERCIRKTAVESRDLDVWRRCWRRCRSRTKMSLWRRQRSLWRQRQEWSAERAIQRRNKN